MFIVSKLFSRLILLVAPVVTAYADSTRVFVEVDNPSGSIVADNPTPEIVEVIKEKATEPPTGDITVIWPYMIGIISGILLILLITLLYKKMKKRKEGQ